jgi:predicted ArsR family transcriptional regulator
MSSGVVAVNEVLDVLIGRFHGRASAPELAAELAVSPATVRRCMVALSRTGWAELERGRRKRYVYVATVAGRRAYDAARAKELGPDNTEPVG